MRLFFRQYGQGFPVIILHGLFGQSDNWVSFGRRLSEEFSVFIPDLRNHGQSPHSAIFDFSSMEADLMEFLEERGFREVILIGHSLGGKIAMLFSLDHPDLVKKLVVVDISLRGYPENSEHLNLIDAMMSVDFDRVKSRSDAEKQLEKKVKSERLRQFLLKNVYWKSPSKLGWRLNLEGIRENIMQVFQEIEKSSTFTKPVLFIRGGKSDYIPEEDLPEITKKFPRVVIETIDSASHWVHADEPGKFYDRVIEFLR